ncbi:FAD-dependent monooxygenase [Sphingobium mellinum]|uniref:FAD-dependent monooxygenase n=1 Tax=Sphingobium mellinum TaxID=1387166 RepID=UPI0030EB2E19
MTCSSHRDLPPLRGAIVGSGPLGPSVGQLLRAEGVDCLILELQDRDQVANRIRAVVLETVNTDLMHRFEIGVRMDSEGFTSPTMRHRRLFSLATGRASYR